MSEATALVSNSAPVAAWSAAGFAGELVPVCGPGCKHPDCDSPGKVPHVKGWQHKTFKASDFRDGGNIGLRTRYFPAVDIDCEDSALVETIVEVAREHLGSAPARGRNNSPRCALLYRLDGEPFKKTILKFTTPAGASEKIEILGDGQHLVTAGRHKSGANIDWTGLPAAEKLAPLNVALRADFLSAVRGALEKAGCTLDPQEVPRLLPVQHRSGKSYPPLKDALAAFNRDHGDDWQRPGRTCPACEHKGCFGPLSETPGKWFCFSADHSGVGQRGEGGWFGDALDLAAHAAGRTTTEHLRAEGYLAPQTGPDMDDDRATNGATGAQTPHGEAERLTESGNAERFAREHGAEVRYCRPLKKWLVWDGQRWKPDDSGEAERLAKKTIRGIAAAAAEEEDGGRNKALLSWAFKSESAKARAALLQLAQSEDGIPVAPGDLDSNPWLLNVGNGTLDLRTGALRSHEQRDFITRLAPVEYHPDARCPTWDRFLERVMGGNRELVEFLQRVIGYTLTGDVSAEVLCFHVGTGDNGKSKFVGALQEMLGGYAGSINSELLLTSRNNDGANRATPDVIRLHGLRLAICSETDEGRFLSAAMVKKITSTDKIPARGLHAASTEFCPTHKIFLPTNHRPQVRSADEGTWRRLLLVPWKVRIPPAEQDPDLPNKLRGELPGILAWAVRGCLDWQKRGGGKRGLAAPECVLSATATYRTEEDVIAPFIADRCEQAPEASCAKGAIFAAYQRWATDNNETAISARAFGTRLLELPGIGDSKSGGVRFWNGIRTRGAP